MSIHQTPAKLTPRYIPRLWGGTLLRETLAKPLPADNIGESWEASAHPNGQSAIATGLGAGMAFGDFARGTGFYGEQEYDTFPLLIKLLAATQDLSVQVHPSDRNCEPGEAGKSEAWCVLSAPAGARIVYGVNCSRREFAQAIQARRLESCLNWVEVAAGDVYVIPPGTVHALGAGIVVYEVQQNSDTTYRLYDWNRIDAATGKPRALHLVRALTVMQSAPHDPDIRAVNIQSGGVQREVLAHNPRFTLERLLVQDELIDHAYNAFAVYTVTQGRVRVLTRSGEECFTARAGETFVVPAAAEALRSRGRATLLKAHIPPAARYRKWLAQIGCELQPGQTVG